MDESTELNSSVTENAKEETVNRPTPGDSLAKQEHVEEPKHLSEPHPVATPIPNPGSSIIAHFEELPKSLGHDEIVEQLKSQPKDAELSQARDGAIIALLKEYSKTTKDVFLNAELESYLKILESNDKESADKYGISKDSNGASL